MLVQDRTPQSAAISSGYYRITGDENLAHLLQQIHSCCIANGNELEKLVFEFSTFKNKLDGYDFNGKNWLQPKPGEVFLIKGFKIAKGLFCDKGTHMDFVIATSKEVRLIELKDGSNFDTKKSTGEYQKLSDAKRFLEENDPFNRTYQKTIVFWNAKNLSEVSFKEARAKKEGMLMLGGDFAKIAKVDYNKLNLSRYEDRKTNENYILEEMTKLAKSRGKI